MLIIFMLNKIKKKHKDIVAFDTVTVLMSNNNQKKHTRDELKGNLNPPENMVHQQKLLLRVKAIKIWEVIADGLTCEEWSHYEIVFSAEKQPESIATYALKLKSQWAFTRTNSQVP